MIDVSTELSANARLRLRQRAFSRVISDRPMAETTVRELIMRGALQVDEVGKQRGTRTPKVLVTHVADPAFEQLPIGLRSAWTELEGRMRVNLRDAMLTIDLREWAGGAAHDEVMAAGLIVEDPRTGLLKRLYRDRPTEAGLALAKADRALVDSAAAAWEAGEDLTIEELAELGVLALLLPRPFRILARAAVVADLPMDPAGGALAGPAGRSAEAHASPVHRFVAALAPVAFALDPEYPGTGLLEAADGLEAGISWASLATNDTD